MAEVKWIKVKVGMFDGSSFKKIKRAKIGGVSYRDKLTAVWFELLDLAGKCNRDGCLIDNNDIPYETTEDIATMLDRDEEEVKLCLTFFLNEKMVEIVDKTYCIANFREYQNTEALEKIREQKRLSQQRWRDKKRKGLVGAKEEVETIEEEQKDVDIYTTSTDHLPSYSYSISNNNKKINKESDNKARVREGYISEVAEIIDNFGYQFSDKVRESILRYFEEWNKSTGIVQDRDRVECYLNTFVNYIENDGDERVIAVLSEDMAKIKRTEQIKKYSHQRGFA